MVKILFICHGNICRSPMAEFIMKDLVAKAGLENEFFIASAATSTEELGNGVYPPARDILRAHGIGCKGKTAVQLTPADYEKYDLLIVMDDYNLRNIKRIIKSDSEGKIHKLMDYCGGGNVSDPWYTRDFETAYNDILRGCKALLDELLQNVL